MIETEEITESPDWAKEIKAKMARGQVEGFFIYSDGGREIDFMEKIRDRKSGSSVSQSSRFMDFLVLFKKKFRRLWKP